MSVGDEEVLQPQPLSLKVPEFVPKFLDMITFYDLCFCSISTPQHLPWHSSLKKKLLHLFKAMGENQLSHFRSEAMAQLNLFCKSVPRGL